MTIKKEVLAKYANKAPVFIETGTHTGNTTKIAAGLGFKMVYTIELAEHFYKQACDKFRYYKNVKCIFGDSQEKLKDILQDLNETAVFWLDGHWSMGDTACGEKAVPLLEELNIIKSHHINNHIILIDDIRLMGDQTEKVTDWKNISLENVKQKCLEINNNYNFKFENGYVKNDILVAFI